MFGSSDDEDMDEEGEADMEDGYDAGAEEGEFEQEEDGDELVSDEESDEDIPKAIPIDPNAPAINHESRDPDQDMSSSVSDINVDSYSDSSDYDQDHLDPGSTANPHGFMYSNMLDTF